jgi:hypothetical protein
MADRTGFPNAPLVDANTGLVFPVWQRFFLALWNRSGGAIGTSLADLVAALTAETSAREAGDAALQSALTAETASRQAAVSAEAAARQAADAALSAQIAGGSPLTRARLWMGLP